MDKISTPSPRREPAADARSAGPSKMTLAMIRQFARTCVSEPRIAPLGVIMVN